MCETSCLKLIKSLYFPLYLRHHLVVVVTGGLARFFRLYEESQPVWGGVPAVNNQDLGKAGLARRSYKRKLIFPKQWPVQ